MFPAALKSIQTAAQAGELLLSPVFAWEIGVLVSRGQLSLGIPPDVSVVREADPADRMLVSTAMLLGLKLVTRDSRILAYGAQGHVSVLPC